MFSLMVQAFYFVNEITKSFCKLNILKKQLKKEKAIS